ncbi:penicillin-binding protein [bacterium]|nr:MAG: penicillin-binding protein [bacterium]
MTKKPTNLDRGTFLRRRGRKRFLISSLLVGSIVTMSVLALGVIYIVVIIRELPSPEQFETRQVSQSTKIYDRTGQALLYEIHGEEKRTVVPFGDIPEKLKQATMAAEDANFYTRPAFDWRGILRALWVDVTSLSLSQGGSTITQQLARNVFLSGEKTLTRKLKELILAIELESKYSKDEVLNLYLNQIPYGSNAYGVEAASQTFFNKSAKNLNLAESALLAGLPKAPSYYSPWGSHVADLMGRKDYVLDRMAELGQITKGEAEKTKKEKIKFSPPSLGSIKAPHFSLMVKDYLVNKYGESAATTGGLRVITTLDWEMQQAAEKTIEEGATRNETLYGGKNASMVAQDPKTGQILALVGSKDYFDTNNGGNFNVAVQGLRQPGSTLKPFAYMTAFQRGYPPKTILFDVPTEFVPNNPSCPVVPQFNNSSLTGPTECFHPQDFEPFLGPIPMEQALAQSVNVAAVKTLYLVGLKNVLSNVHLFGITTLNEPWRYGLSLVLGGGEVKLIDLVNAYATLSQEGTKHDQTSILEVGDSHGNILETYHDNATRTIDPQYPKLVNKILSDKDLRSGLFQSSLGLTIFPNHDVALKTGTTNDYRDAWAMGYTPSLVVGVWAGNNDNTPMQRKGTSILAAVPIWSAFLNLVLPKYPSESFSVPDPVTPTSKPMLNGQYAVQSSVGGVSQSQIHSLLYYIDKNDPLGPPHQNPADDPQFINWETGVVDWLKQNAGLVGAYLNTQTNYSSLPAAPQDQLSQSGIVMKNTYPENGSFVSSPFSFQSELSSYQKIKRVEIYLNHRLLSGFDSDTQDYNLRYVVTGPLGPQNVLELRITNESGKTVSVPMIFYH